mmetsp:Transcript_12478/g.23894  ORF Transcript_12478/g.23894 Transcript_12478/m.23894 type:complete len:95 (-) Transcript_12478:146-430(-)
MPFTTPSSSSTTTRNSMTQNQTPPHLSSHPSPLEKKATFTLESSPELSHEPAPATELYARCLLVFCSFCFFFSFCPLAFKLLSHSFFATLIFLA